MHVDYFIQSLLTRIIHKLSLILARINKMYLGRCEKEREPIHLAGCLFPTVGANLVFAREKPSGEACLAPTTNSSYDGYTIHPAIERKIYE